jgi:Tol biopolymer transport system component
MKNQKQLIVLIVVATSLSSFLGGYLLTQPTRLGTDILQQQRGALIDRFNGLADSSTPGPLPPGLLQASTDSALGLTNAPDTDSVLYYHPNTGNVSSLNLETRANKLISTANLSNLVNVVWSPDKNRVLTVSRNSTSLVYRYFDYTTHENGVLGANIKDAVFSPDSRRVAFVQSGGGDSVIIVADFDGKNSKTILKTRLVGIKLFWPSAQNLAFMASDTDTSTQSLFGLDLAGNLTQLLDSQDTLAVNWSPDGSKFIYSDQEGGGTATYLYDVSLQQSQPLSVQTSAHLCAWPANQNSLTCAVQNQGETSIIQIPLSSLTPKIIFSHLIITAKDAFLSHSENFFVLTSLNDQSVWAVKLTP